MGTKANISVIQSLSLILVILVNGLLTFKSFIIVVAAISTAHYLFCFYYSMPSIKNMVRSKLGLLKIVGMVALTFLSAYFKQPAILLYFGLHHSLSETFILQDQLESTSRKTLRTIFGLRILFHAIVYAQLSMVGGAAHFFEFLEVFFVLAAVACIYLGFVVFSSLPDKQKEKLFLSDGLFIVLCLLTYYNILKFDFLMLDLYHCLFWILFPTATLIANGDQKGSARYINLNLQIIVGVGLAIFAFYPYFPKPTDMDANSLPNIILDYGGYAHISMSFFLLKFKHVFWEKKSSLPQTGLTSPTPDLI